MNMNPKTEIGRVVAELSKSYYKVLKVNLTSDTYKIIKSLKEEPGQSQGVCQDTFSVWIQTFCDAGCVYEGDAHVFKSRLALDALRKYFRDNESHALRYRRQINGEFRWVYMEIIRTEHYSDESQEVWLFVKDVHNNYTREMENMRELEHYCKYDSLTGLNNYYSYQIFCRNFAEQSSNKSVGVIFADLNGLKLINDTRGHQAGNDFLISFSRKLLKFFSNDDIYRISGDEFLIVQSGIAQEQFLAGAVAFRDFINEEDVPQASIGFSWSPNATHIEDVCRNSEVHMYDSKEQFYKVHPEYKRGIAELNYKREMDAILKTLANSYDAMATIDLVHDTFWMLKTTSLNNLTKNVTSYTELNAAFINHVDVDYREIVSRINNIDYLRQQLGKRSSIVCDYKLKNGFWYQTTFRALEVVNGEPTKALFIVERIEQERVLDLEKVKHLQLEHQIIEGLSTSFSLICHISISTKKVMVYRNNSLKASVTAAISSLDYDGVSSWFVDKFVVKEDQERTADFLKFENVVSSLENKEVSTLLFRTTPEFHDTKQPSYSQFLFYKLASNPDIIILATKNVTHSMG